MARGNRALIWSGLASLLIFILIGAFWAFPKEPADPHEALEKAFQFFNSKSYVRGDEAWLIGLAAMQSGDQGYISVASDLRHINLIAEVERMMFELRKEEVLLPKRADGLLEPATRGMKFDASISMADARYTKSIMSLALGCRSSSVADLLAMLRNLKDSPTGYVLTHEILALVTISRMGCMPEQRIKNLLDRRLQWVAEEFDKNPFPERDLAYEQMVVLCYAGYCDYVSDSFLTRLVRAQHDDGGWGHGERLGAGHVTREHTSALALFGLSCKLYCGEKTEHASPVE